jgi:hypothetical protein
MGYVIWVAGRYWAEVIGMTSIRNDCEANTGEREGLIDGLAGPWTDLVPYLFESRHLLVLLMLVSCALRYRFFLGTYLVLLFMSFLRYLVRYTDCSSLFLLLLSLCVSRLSNIPFGIELEALICLANRRMLVDAV